MRKSVRISNGSEIDFLRASGTLKLFVLTILNTHNLPTLINDSLTLSSTSGSGWSVSVTRTVTTATKCGPPL